MELTLALNDILVAIGVTICGTILLITLGYELGRKTRRSVSRETKEKFHPTNLDEPEGDLFNDAMFGEDEPVKKGIPTIMEG
jgi:hypothetical protein